MENNADVRITKFRGLYMGTEWVYGYRIGDNLIGTVTYGENGHVTVDEYWFVRPETIRQFTGLYDKNGQEIFEGDIVKGTDGYGNPMTWEVAFECVASEWTGFNVGADDDDCEVVGNIYQTPELLK